MRIVKEAEERKAEILDAAEMLFNSKGYDVTTVNDILAVTKIAKGTFYYHFKSKENVMDAVVTRRIEAGVQTALAVAGNKELSIQERILGVILSQKPTGSESEQIKEHLHRTENALLHQKVMVECVLSLTPILQSLAEEGINNKLFSTPYPKESVEIILTAALVLFDDDIFPWTQEEQAQKIAPFILCIERTLGAKPGDFSFMLAAFSQEEKE